MVMKQERPRQTEAPAPLVEAGQRILDDLQRAIGQNQARYGNAPIPDQGLFWANRTVDMRELARRNSGLSVERFEGLLVHQVCQAVIDARYPRPQDAQRHYAAALDAERRYYNLRHPEQIPETVASGNQSMTIEQYNRASQYLRTVARSARDLATRQLSAVPRTVAPRPTFRYEIPLSRDEITNGVRDVAEIQSARPITNWGDFFKQLGDNPHMEGVRITVRGAPLPIDNYAQFAQVRLGLVGSDNLFNSWERFGERVRQL